MPTPSEGESKEEFIERCIPVVLDDGTAEDGAQAYAVCLSLWNEDKNGRSTQEQLCFAPTEVMEMSNGIERRYGPAEMRALDDGRIEGYAAVFNQPSGDLGGFREVIRPGAFTKTVQEADIRALFNHDPNYVLGRNRAGTLELVEDAHGLHFRADPPETGWANDLRASIRRGDIDQASFGFQTVRDEWFVDQAERRRELVEVRLFDVSPVTFPAYPQTKVSVRSLAELFMARVAEEGDEESVRYLVQELSRTFGGEQGQELRENESLAAPVQVDHPDDVNPEEAEEAGQAVQPKRNLDELKRELKKLEISI